MKVDDLAKLLGKSKWEVEEMVKKSDVIELNLNERRQRYKEEDDFRIFE